MGTSQYLSVPEAGQRLGVGRTRAYQLAHAGILPTIRLGTRKVLVPVAALDRLSDLAVEESLAAQARLHSSQAVTHG